MLERLIRLALFAYPPSLREARGEEIVATAIEAADGSSSGALLELVGLLRGGVRERAAAAAAAPLRRLVADAFCLSACLWIAIELLRWLTGQLEPYPLAAPWQLSLLGACLALALVGLDRLAGAFGLAWVALANPWMPLGGHWVNSFAPEWTTGVVRNDVLLIACLLVMVIAPRRRPVDPRRLLWLVLLAAVASVDSLDQAEPVIPIMLLTLGGLSAMTLSPRVAIAVPLWWIGLWLEPLIGAAEGNRFSDIGWTVDLCLLAATLALALLPLWLAASRRQRIELRQANGRQP